MTREEAKEVFENAPKHIKLINGQICYSQFFVEAIEMAIKVLEQQPSKDMEEIEEVINCDADAETKCKMISNILTAKPHYFEKQEPIDKSEMMHDIYMEGVNMTGEYQGCWVRFKDIEKIVDKYIGSEET